MDPISLTAAVLSIMRSVTIVNDTVRLVSSLKNAPLEFLDLRNEVGDDPPYVAFLINSAICSSDLFCRSYHSWRRFEATWTCCGRWWHQLTPTPAVTRAHLSQR